MENQMTSSIQEKQLENEISRMSEYENTVMNSPDLDLRTKAKLDPNVIVPSSTEWFFSSESAGPDSWSFSSVILKDIYFTNDWVFICADRIASKLSAVPLKVYIANKKGDEIEYDVDQENPINRLLQSPNPWQDGVSMLYSMITDYCVTGNGILLHQPILGHLIHVPSEMVNMVFLGDRVPTYFLASINFGQIPHMITNNMELNTGNVIHIKRPNPSSAYWGLSPLIPGNKSVAFYNLSQEFLNNFYTKGALPGLVLKMDKEANEKTALRMLQSFEQAYSGRRNQRRHMILPYGVTSEQLETRLADQELLEFMALDRETIINLYQIPKEELSIQEATGWNTDQYNQAIRNFWNGPLKTIGAQIERTLTKRLQNLLGKDRVIRFDYSVVPQMQENMKEKGETATSLMPTWTINEIRQQIYNMPPLPGGDVCVTLQNLTNQAAMGGGFFQQQPGNSREPSPEGEREPQPQNQNNPQQENQESQKIPTSEDTQDDSSTKARRFENNVALIRKDLTEPSNSEIIKRRETSIQVISEKTFPKLNRQARMLFQSQADMVADILTGRSKATDSDIDRWEQEIKAAINSANLKRIWSEAYEKNTIAQMNVGYKTTFMLPWDFKDERKMEAIRLQAQDAMRRELRKRGERTFAQVNETTLDAIMKQINAGVLKGDTVNQISESIKQYFSPQEIPWRTQRIARTETLIATSMGQAAAGNVASANIPGLKKVWLNAGDVRVRGNPGGKYAKSEYDHWSIGGEMVDYNRKFSNGLRYPREGSGAAANIINCFPADTIVEAAGIEKSFQRHYVGPMITVEFASGDKLTGTPNHPILTLDGWVPLGKLDKGQKAIKAGGLNRLAVRNHNKNSVQSSIGEVFKLSQKAGVMMGMVGVLADFHGDGLPNQNVNIVNVNRGLVGASNSPAFAEVYNSGFFDSDFAESQRLGPGRLYQSGSSHFHGAVAHRFIGSSNLSQSLLSIHLTPFESFGLTPVSLDHANGLEPIGDELPTAIELHGNLVDRDLLDKVHMDEVICINVSSYHGPVYNLQTASGWYLANNFVVHNCRCDWFIVPPEDASRISLEGIPGIP